MGRGDVGHATAKPQPAGQREHDGTVHRKRAEIQRDTPRLGQAAQLRNAQLDGRNPCPVGFGQLGGHIQSIVARRLFQRMAMVQGDDFLRREWFSR